MAETPNDPPAAAQPPPTPTPPTAADGPLSALRRALERVTRRFGSGKQRTTDSQQRHAIAIDWPLAGLPQTIPVQVVTLNTRQLPQQHGHAHGRRATA